MPKEQPTPLEVLIRAQLVGTASPSFVPMTYTWVFRDNEQAAELALRVLEQAGYKVVPIKRTTVVNYQTYICPICGAEKVLYQPSHQTLNQFLHEVSKIKDVLCGWRGCEGRAIPIEEANKIQESELT